ncbi:MAG: DNA internalization-related competence protein ComEC/Rec2 [Actinomycetota bacterium]|nr:DNA internalization-related competence protein ComEC/Rec2 [Actinomycetota bacterium]
MGYDLLLRGRLLLCAFAATVGGWLGAGEGTFILWLVMACTASIPLALMLRKKGVMVAWIPLCMLFLAAGCLMGQAGESAWGDRGGPAGEVHLVGSVDVGCRGEPGNEACLLKVSLVLEGDKAREGDRYLLRYREGERPRWGDEVEVEGSLYIFEDVNGGVGGSLRVTSMVCLGHTRNPFLRAALAFRDSLREATINHLEPDQAGLVEGMLLGDYRRLEAQDLEALRSSGLIHLCAASGLHLGLVVVFVLWLGRRMRLSRRVAVILQVPFLLTYSLAVGLTVPVQRAVAVALVAASALLLGRDFDFLPALGVAVLYLVVRDPGAAAGTSFQLSVAAALGIAMLQAPLASFLRLGESMPSRLLAATLAAQLATGPLLLYHFGGLSLLATPGNILVLPLVPLVMALAMTSSLLGVIGLPMAWLPLKAASPIVSLLLGVARIMAAHGWAEIRIFPLSATWLLVYYPALAVAFLTGGRWRRLGRVALVLMLTAAMLAGCTVPSVVFGGGGGTRLSFIDVGQGDATLLQTGSGVTVLVDGGDDPGRLADELRMRGVRYLDAVVVSHPEKDHIGGLEGALDVCGVGVLLHPGTENKGAAAKLLGAAGEMGVYTRVMREGDVLSLGEITLRALGPAPDAPEELSTNDNSLVLRVDGPEFSILLTGDVEEAGESALMKYAEKLNCDLLKVPHHGGFCDTNGEFFDVVRPMVAVICVGEDNSYGHPSGDTLECLDRMGCSAYRTDLHGDIVIHVVEGGYRVECERQEVPEPLFSWEMLPMSPIGGSPVLLVNSRHRLLVEEEFKVVKEKIAEKVDPYFPGRCYP